MTVTVYTKPNCMQCRATQKALTKAHIPHTLVDLTTNPEALQHVQDKGYLQAPVVETAGDMWSGFRPERIKELANHMHGAPIVA